MESFPRRELERLSYYPGQDLLARDFRAQAAVESQRRWWHNRALHGAYGVRFGLQALPVPGTAPIVAEVLPGLAYDPFGRELVLGATRRLAAPAAAAGDDPAPLLLVLRDAEAAALAACGTPAAGAGDTAELAWQPEERWRPADGVPLARLAVGGGELSWDLAFLPPFAAPEARPKVESGRTLAGGTAWVPWPAPALSHRLELGLLVWVDTRAAGFTQLPCYFAWLAGSLSGLAVPPVAVLDFVGRTFLHGFYFHVRPMPVPAAEPVPSEPGLTGAGSAPAVRRPTFSDIWRLARERLSVCWLGLQMRPGSGRPARLQPEVSDEKP
jgi:hypothetical protein